MEQTKTLRQKLRQFLVILLPILVTQLSLSAMTFFDTTMSGHVSPQDLAGVAIGASLWMPMFAGLSGVLYAVVPMVAQLYGAGRTDKIAYVVVQGAYLSIAVGALVIAAGAAGVGPLLAHMGLESSVAAVAKQFLAGIAFGVIPFFLYTVLHCFIDALGHTRVTMLITLVAVPINLALNYLLVFGKLGMPRLGGAGAGYASALTYWSITLLTMYVIHTIQPFRGYRIFQARIGVQLAAWREQLTIGLPMGFAIFCETSIFAVVTLLMSQFDTVAIAAYQAAMNFSSLVYMLPLSISMALTILVGFEVGGKRLQDARQYSYLGIGCALLLAVLNGLVLVLLRDKVAMLYSEDSAVLQLTASFLLYAAFYQLSDAVAVPIQGILRGYKDVKVPFALALVSYWIVGLPLGHYLARYTAFGPYGYWLGLIGGLAFSAVCLGTRMRLLQRRLAAR